MWCSGGHTEATSKVKLGVCNLMVNKGGQESQEGQG